MRSILILGKTWELGHVLERGGEAIFGLYLFLKRKEEGKLDECSKRLWYGYLSKFGYGFTHLLVRNPPNSPFDCVWIGKTIS